LATTLVELDWRASIAGKQVGGHFGMNVIQACEQVFEELPASAFNQEDAREWAYAL